MLKRIDTYHKARTKNIGLKIKNGSRESVRTYSFVKSMDEIQIG